MIDHLILNNRKYYYEAIVNDDFDRIHLAPFELVTLAFCRDWLRGQEHFQITTSGSTGKPKPIRLSRSQMKASAAMTIEKLGLDAGDHILVCMDTAYIAGKMMLVRGFEGNMAMTIVTPSANPFATLSPNTRFVFTAFVPLQIKTLLNGPPEYLDILDGMKAIIIGGGVVNSLLEAAIQAIKSPVYSTYAMTETVSHIAMRRLNGSSRSNIYQTLPGVKIGLDDRGCLTIHAPVTNFETIVTNDLVTIIDENSFTWEGRIDNVINSGGIKIHTEQLEQSIALILGQLNLQCHFFVTGIPHEALGEIVVLIMEGQPLNKKVEQALLETLKQSLPTYHEPKKVYYFDQFILTDTGKIQRKKSLEAYLPNNDAQRFIS